MLFGKLEVIWLLLLQLLMSGCASSPAPSVYVAQTQVEVPPPPPALVKVSQEAPDFVKWMEQIYSSSMARLGLSQPSTQQPQTSLPKP